MPLFKPCCQLKSIHARHFIVENHGIDLVFLGLKHVKCMTAIDGGDHFVTILTEQGSVQFPNPRVVVHAHHG